jgi:hypothetical protein
MNTTPIRDRRDRGGNAGTGLSSLQARDRVHPEDSSVVNAERLAMDRQLQASTEAASQASPAPSVEAKRSRPNAWRTRASFDQSTRSGEMCEPLARGHVDRLW